MMTAEQLKDSILLLAMQGKLKTACSADESITTTLQQIYDGKGTIKLISPDQVPYDLPERWAWARLEDITDNCDNPFADGPFGSNLKREHYTDRHEVRIIQLSNIGENGWKDKNEKYTTYEHLKTIERSKVYPGDIVIAKMMPAGRAIEVPENVYSYVLSSDAVKFVAHPLLNKRFLLMAINSPIFREQVYAEVHGVTRVRTSLKKLRSYIVPLPPLEEQKRIVAKIEELMPFVEQYAEASTKLNILNTTFPNQMKKSILQQAVMGKLVPQDPNDEPASVLLEKIAKEKKRLIKEGKIKKQKSLPEITEDEIPFDIPNSWEWARWGTISHSIQYGYNAPAKDFGCIKMVRISDIHDNKVHWDTVPYCEIADEIIPDYLLKENDILFARTGGTVGKSFLVKEVSENAVYAGYLIRTRYSHLLCPEYLKFFMESDLYWRQLRKGTIATAQPNCNGQTLSKMLIPVPPLQEQYRIVEKLSSLLTCTDELAI